MLGDYDIIQDVLSIYCDNISTINIFKNHVQHFRTKHINIRYHFIRKLVESKIVCLDHIATKIQLIFLSNLLMLPNLIHLIRKESGICTI